MAIAHYFWQKFEGRNEAIISANEVEKTEEAIVVILFCTGASMRFFRYFL